MFFLGNSPNPFSLKYGWMGEIKVIRVLQMHWRESSCSLSAPLFVVFFYFWRAPLFVNLASSSMMIDCWPQKKWRDSCCSIFPIMGVRSGSVRYKRQKRLIWRKVAFCLARKLARSDFGAKRGARSPSITLLLLCWCPAPPDLLLCCWELCWAMGSSDRED